MLLIKYCDNKTYLHLELGTTYTIINIYRIIRVDKTKLPLSHPTQLNSLLPKASTGTRQQCLPYQQPKQLRPALYVLDPEVKTLTSRC